MSTPSGAGLGAVSKSSLAADRAIPTVGRTPQSRGIVLSLPQGTAVWSQLVPNPLEGRGGIAPEDLEREDFRYFCDPCGRGFHSKRVYDEHMADHVWCTYPGCKFTVRKGKEWRMEMHVASLHNRPDAPDLADTGKYLEARKQRFPTSDLVKKKVEELYYRAGKGEVLPDERRRWLRQHGVYVSKKWFVPVLREGDELLEAVRDRRRKEGPPASSVPAAPTAVAGDKRPQRPDTPTEGTQRRPPQPPAADVGSGDTASGNIREDVPSIAAEEPDSGSASASVATTKVTTKVDDPLAKYQRRPGEKMLPLGPNGRYTKPQLVQLMRERYDAARRVPDFYVCTRCGEKGSHWVEACPTRANAAFDVNTEWGAPMPSNKSARETASSPTTASVPKQSEEESHPIDAVVPKQEQQPQEQDDRSDAGAPCETSAAPPPGADTTGEDGMGASKNLSTIPARTAAARDRAQRRAATAEDRPSTAGSKQQGARRLYPEAMARRGPPKPPTLFEKLTEDQRLDEDGLLLQALRFFVQNDFLTPSDASKTAKSDADKEEPQQQAPASSRPAYRRI